MSGKYRVDISRPEFCRGQLAGRGDLWVVSTWAFQNYPRLVQDRIQQDGLKAWVYGTANHVHENNRAMQAWALDAWLGGAVGVVPWQTVDKTGRALTEADPLGLLIFDQPDPQSFAIRHSLRLKAFRDAEQLIAYLTELDRREGWNRFQTRAFVERYVRWTSSVAKADAVPLLDRLSIEVGLSVSRQTMLWQQLPHGRGHRDQSIRGRLTSCR